MPAKPRNEASYHILLIGVDDYRGAPLNGCVNDIDLVQQVLLGKRMGIAKDRIRRLASPRGRTSRARSVPEQAATLRNIRDALAELGSKKVVPGDRVFIYYSGHGTRVEVTTPDGRKSHCEALVPVDYDAEPDKQFLFDHELNELLAAIVGRTRSVTAVFDCCYAAGATRAAGEPSETMPPRFLDLDRLPDGARALRAAVPARAANGHRGGKPRRRLGSVDDCHVVAACLNHEVAREAISEPKHGLLTRAFVDALKAAKDTELPTVTWAKIWPTIQARVRDSNPAQHPWMAGNLGRAVFGGPPVDRDPGFPVTRDGDEYRVGAGRLAGITEGAVLAVYGDDTRYFPPLGSQQDLTARKGQVRVTDATDASATAILEGKRFELRVDARCRLVKAGIAARLPCAVVPADAALVRQLKASPLLEVVDARRASVTLRRHDKQWFVTDAIHGTRPPAPILVALRPDQLELARQVLEHYYVYSRPLRMAEQINNHQGGLELRVLSAPAGGIDAAKAQAQDLPEAPSKGKATYGLRSGSTICFEVHNHTPRALRVTLVNVAAGGSVQLLGDQVIEVDRAYVFWARNNVGAPFHMSLPTGKIHGADRLVAIGRTALDHDLAYLRVENTFEQLLRPTRGGGRPIEGGSETGTDTAELDYWVTAMVVIETRA